MPLTLAVALVLVVAAFLAFVATRPSEFRITRSRTLAAPPEIVHAHVDDLQRWTAWSPWEKLDPGMKREFSGPAAGTGASYHWVGNKKVGEGRMTITASQPGRGVTLRLEFIKPWTATNTTQFDLTPSGKGTDVVWTMTGTNNFMAKAFCVFMNMDKMVGGDFEKGLAGLDAVTAPVPASAQIH
ncbi:MAG: SRPBCC family protein [Vicinamibacteria bacterium]